MKLNRLVATLSVLTFGAAFSFSAAAQTCAGARPWQPPTAGETLQNLTTCGGDTTATQYCGGNQDAPGPAYVIRSNFTGDRTFQTITLTGGAAGFDPVMYMSAASSGCGTNAACGASGDGGTPINTADVQDGEWFLIVTAAGINAAGACGTFSLASTGSFPVTLKEFSID